MGALRWRKSNPGFPAFFNHGLKDYADSTDLDFCWSFHGGLQQPPAERFRGGFGAAGDAEFLIDVKPSVALMCAAAGMLLLQRRNR